MEFIKIAKLLYNHNWIFAKSMPGSPHWYTLRKDWNNQDFIDCVMYIRKHGYKKTYRGKSYIYFNLNDYMYWTMGEDINYQNGRPCTVLINRAKRGNIISPYDGKVKMYKETFGQDKYKREDRKLMRMINVKDTTLDIGCGYGLFLNYHTPIKYVGVDPSSDMLLVLKEKYPDAITINCKFEDFYLGSSFNTIVALYGVASYIDPIKIYRIKEMLNPGGEAFLMYYAKDYNPVSHKFVKPPFIYSVPSGGEIFGNYKIIRVKN